MGAVGIVAEYNPFHAGHLRQLRELDADRPVIAAFSGDFVQRGEPAAFDKFARAEAAVRCGVSLVLELPLPWCLSSAEGFARGGVGLLAATGVVDTISFGSESGDLSALLHCADALEREDYPDQLRSFLQEGISFAAAREKAVAALAGEETSKVLHTPNDLLAVEYIRAARKLGAPVSFAPVRRTGSVHDGPGSASELRRRMGAGEEWLSGLPEPSRTVFEREMALGRGPVLPGSLRLPILSRLRERSADELRCLPDAAEGLENRLYDAIQTGASPEEIAMAAKSKRYALARLRRMVMCAALGVTEGMAEEEPPYLRVLAMDEKGMALLREMREKAVLPIAVKSAHVRQMDSRTQSVFALGSRAHDLYVLGRPAAEHARCGEDWTFTPYIHERTEGETVCP